MGSCKIAIGLSIAVSIVLLFYVANLFQHLNKESFNLKPEELGIVPSRYRPDIPIRSRDNYYVNRGWGGPFQGFPAIQRKACLLSKGKLPLNDPEYMKAAQEYNSNKAKYNNMKCGEGFCAGRVGDYATGQPWYEETPDVSEDILVSDMGSMPDSNDKNGNKIRSKENYTDLYASQNWEGFDTGMYGVNSFNDAWVTAGSDPFWGSRGEAPAFWEPNPYLTMHGYYNNRHNPSKHHPMKVQEEFTNEQLYKAAGGSNAENY